MKTMKNALIAIAFICSLGGVAVVLADELPAEKIELKDGSTLYLHPDGTSRMVDPHGKKIEMRDGEEMQLADGRTIMMSMGSLGHYMHDLSAHGFAIEDFLHEGNGDIWSFAMTDPKAVVGWMAIEEKAEGGDALYLEAKRHPAFLDGFIRVAEGGGVALYRR